MNALSAGGESGLEALAGSGPITVSIVEGHPATRASLAAWLDRVPELHCLDLYASGEAAVAGMAFKPPEVALVDIHLPDMSSLECVARLRERLPELRVLLLTWFEEADLLFEALRRGACGYLSKPSIPGELVATIQQFRAGGATMSTQIARKVIRHFDRIRRPKSAAEKLSRPEAEILMLLAKGCDYGEISDWLDLSRGQVQAQLRQIYEKLHAQTRARTAANFFGGAWLPGFFPPPAGTASNRSRTGAFRAVLGELTISTAAKKC